MTYSHKSQTFQSSAYAGPGGGKLIRANSNCMGSGALEVLPKLREVLAVDAALCLDYDDGQLPTGKAARLRALLGDREGVDPGRVILGGSGLDWIPGIAGALGVATIVRVEGDFHGYDRYALLHGVKVVTVPVHPITRELDPAVLADHVRGRKNAMLCLTLPATNPVQSPIGRAHVVAALAANPDLIVLADGAYRQFAGYWWLADLAEEFEQVIYLQVASKDLFLPGGRLSWIVPSKRFAARLTETRAPYPLNTVAVAQAEKLLGRPDLLAAMKAEQGAARDILIRGLAPLGLETIFGQCPWVSFQWRADARELVERLQHQWGILVQQQRLAPLDGTWVRVSATVKAEARYIVQAIETETHRA